MYIRNKEQRREYRKIDATEESKRNGARRNDKRLQGWYDVMIKSEEPNEQFKHKPFCNDIGVNRKSKDK